ncbi:CBS domain-containing protein [Bacillus tianshenii]|nr:CBS domain-containing protein [Bacillus tianshenii]
MAENRTNAERFLSAYNTITKELELIVGMNKYLPFFRLVDMAKKKNGIVMHFKDDLKEYSYLRNAIVHDRDFPERVIADPHISVVEKLEYIASQLTEPQTLIPIFERDVVTFDISQTVQELMDGIKIFGFSQFPVMQNGICTGLITDRGITRWFVNDLEKCRQLNEITLKDVLNFEKNIKNYTFMAKSKNVYDIRELFYHHLERHGVRLEAVLITDNGRPDERLLGIITPFDMVRLRF